MIKLKNKGFTLVEIMIVVSIVITLAVLAIPNILRSRIAANDAAAMSNLKVVANACQSYHINQGNYPQNLSELSKAEPPYIDSVLAAGTKQGYEFIYTPSEVGFSIAADPVGALKGRYFYIDEAGVMRARSEGKAGPDDPAVE